MIRDAFINGLASPSIRQRLLEQEDLSLQKAYDVAMSLSSAREQANKYKNFEQTSVVVKNVDDILNENTEKSNPEVAAATAKVVMKKSFFCGGPIHARFRCPAKEVNCHSCGKMSFLTYVSFKKQVTSSAVEGLFLSSTLAGSTPECARPSVITTVVDNIPIYTLVDSGSSASYISSAFCLRLGRSPEGPPSKTMMASTSLWAKVNDSTRADLVVSGQRYPKFSFGLMDNLCADVILGVDFMKLHRSIIFKTAGSRVATCLQTRSSTNVQGACNVLAVKVNAPRFFRTVD